MKNGPLLLKHFVIALGLFAGFSVQAVTCHEIIENHALPTVSREFKYQQKSYPYNYVLQSKKIYSLNRELPQLQNSFLISITPSGHTSIFYKGYQLDSSGAPFRNIKSFIRHRSELYSQHVWNGLIFEIQDLPMGFEEHFNQKLLKLKDRKALTCVSSVCRNLRELEIEGFEKSTFIKPTSLLKHLLWLQSQGQQKQGPAIHIYALGKTPEEIIERIQQNESYRGSLLLPRVAIGAALLALVSGTAFGF